MQSKFHSLITKIYKLVDGEIDWLLGSILSRNSNMSKLYENLCYIELNRRKIKSGKIDVIKPKNEVQKQFLENHLVKHNNMIEIVYNSSNNTSILHKSKLIKNIVGNLIYVSKIIFLFIRIPKIPLSGINNLILVKMGNP